MDKAKIGLLKDCEKRLEGLACIVGNLADNDNRPELEIVCDVLIATIAEMKLALELDGKDVG